jgi:hypothetical protein
MSTDRWRSLIRLGILAGLAIGCTEKRVDPTAEPFAEFSRRVDEYVALHNQVAEKVGQLDETKSQPEIAARAVALGYAIVAARPQAKQGDIFTTEIATVFATMIHEEYSRRPQPVLDTREDTQEELPNFVPEVNKLYPTTYPLATFPPSLLPLLPRLPEEVVEYRIVQKYLILRDIEANIIIDFMPNALP